MSLEKAIDTIEQEPNKVAVRDNLQLFYRNNNHWTLKVTKCPHTNTEDAIIVTHTLPKEDWEIKDASECYNFSKLLS